ncbi:MAG: shikimate kinase [Oscillospiraceae bacterium]|nr:shikimate kinase [Oscillospiraceae bacterium]
MNKLYLCGFMGCGKTFAGKAVSERLGVPFADLDQIIETCTGQKIPDIIQGQGINRFRDLESEFLDSSDIKSCHIISLGGGAVLRSKNVTFIKQRGILVFIDTDFETCYLRIKGDPDRPLAYEKSRNELEELYQARKKIYLENAVYTVDGNTDIQTLTGRLMLIYHDNLQC